MLEHEFGGDWTERKLEKLKMYLPAYMKVLSGKGFTIGYIDAFAGTGYRTISKICPDGSNLFDEPEAKDAQDYRDGSAKIALGIEPPFDKYIFIEQDPEKCAALAELKDEFPDRASKIDVRCGDANEEIASLCSSTSNWSKRRAVMFLDPFGLQVEWETIELIAKTQAIDLWYLFSIGAVNRLLEKQQNQHPGFAECLNRTFGSSDWKDEFYSKRKPPSLFDDDSEILYKDTNFEEIGAYVIKRLKTIFPGVAEKPYILKNSKNSPLFMLCFAVGNPSPKAIKPALNIASDLLMKD